MHKSFGILTMAALALAVALCGCGVQDGKTSQVSFVSKRAPIAFKFPSGWHKNKENNPYDLQCFSRSQDMTTGVFVFKRINIAADSTPHDIFQKQVDDIKSKRKNFEVFEEPEKHEDDTRIITTVTHIADKGSSRFCYKFSLIEFIADDSKFAVVIQVAFPGDWEKSKPILESITHSAKPLSEGN